MKPNWQGFLTINPLRGGRLMAYRSPYPVVNAVVVGIWLLRIFSPGSWWGAIFSYQHQKSSSFHPRAAPMELYLLSVHIFGWIAALTPTQHFWQIRTALCVVAVILIIEIIQHHVYILAVRPLIDSSYKQYNWLRTLTFTAIAYVNVATLYAVIYQQVLYGHFKEWPSAISSLAFSIGELTGAGYGPVESSGGDILAIVMSTEKLAGVFFLAVLISLALERVNRPAFAKDPSRKRP